MFKFNLKYLLILLVILWICSGRSPFRFGNIFEGYCGCGEGPEGPEGGGYQGWTACDTRGGGCNHYDERDGHLGWYAQYQ